MTSNAHRDIAHKIIHAQDDEDSVILPNACKGGIIAFDDDTKVRCFSILTKQPHAVPLESWSLVVTPDMPEADGMHDVATDRVMVDHVTRGFIGENAMQFIMGPSGELQAVRLLPPGEGPAQQQWEAQAAKMLE